MNSGSRAKGGGSSPTRRALYGSLVSPHFVPSLILPRDVGVRPRSVGGLATRRLLCFFGLPVDLCLPSLALGFGLHFIYSPFRYLGCRGETSVRRSVRYVRGRLPTVHCQSKSRRTGHANYAWLQRPSFFGVRVWAEEKFLLHV